MFILSRPPTLRWVLAVALVLAGLWADLRPPATVGHPFAIDDLPAGSEVTLSDVRMVEVPLGVFQPVDLPLVLGTAVNAGDPVLETDAHSASISPPEDWLMIELAVPNGARSGGRIVAVVSDFEGGPPESIEGVVVSNAIDDGFGALMATCAFPSEQAGLVAVAAAENRVSVLVGS